ncbi:hypothetical protein QT970_27225 [Microcoleus sp. herbarium8]
MKPVATSKSSIGNGAIGQIGFSLTTIMVEERSAILNQEKHKWFRPRVG